ncbi:hypothetical protein DVA81_19120, partial [Acinetobacter baumannii]
FSSLVTACCLIVHVFTFFQRNQLNLPKARSNRLFLWKLFDKKNKIVLLLYAQFAPNVFEVVWFESSF